MCFTYPLLVPPNIFDSSARVGTQQNHAYLYYYGF
uniref:Uncharacterized protein n=1 Tax=Caudovirales sp. ct7964 TaxID=2825758 RepID=A0A8S5PFA2_9CAUD|nr:MAG TPA: hypothetical protein [Caudovirales sp. ct7964]